MSIFAAIIGALFAIGLVGTVAALALSILAVAYLAVTVKWVPIIYNVRSLTRRKVTTLVTVLGMALVVAVCATVLMLLGSIKKTLVTAGEAGNVVVLRKGATAEITSAIDREQAKLLMARPEVALDIKDGKPLADPQVAVLIFAQRPNGISTDGANVFVRGASERGMTLHSVMKMKEGRWWAPGTSEIVIGSSLVGQFVGAQLGGQMSFARRNWTVVGVFDGGGSSFDSEIWGDVEQVMAAFQRNNYSQLTMRVKDEALIPSMVDAVAVDPRLNLDVKAEQKYFADLSNGLSSLILFLGIFVAVVFSMGATLGAMISMYAQVAARIREVGTLRAIGFQRSSILVSFVLESLLLGVIAGVIGIALSSLMQLATFSTINFGTFSRVTFGFTLTPDVMVKAGVFAILMGYAGGLLPALRAARTTIIDATRG